MKALRQLFYRFQYARYVRQLPFYLIRHYGVRKAYKPKAVDEVIKRYGFNRRFSPIAYALLCKAGDLSKASAGYAPHPDRAYLRAAVAERFFDGDVDFDLHRLMLVSQFKSNWQSQYAPGGNEEYASYIVELEAMTKRAPGE